ncbi:tRNA-dihydrouridine(20) synthase [Pleurostoma richardsiae]|uniref:tRNA-dihydrouridine(20) synthase n=1 Tax=Pleurostoma richardsiae TaxID=41990 RepID=A0AA38SFS0_9PEZI|nr:tRNA-dihydrouridine(20) synthase [Pleurostoma richardsiae]
MSQPVKKVPIPPRGVDYRGKVVLAPMVRSGELPSRLLALHYGADLVWGPETVDRAMIGTTRRVNPATNMIEWIRNPSQTHKNTPAAAAESSVVYRMDPVREAGRLIFQIGTSDPSRAVQAARLVAADVAGIDVNAGCPKPFSTHGGMGAALLRAPDTLCAILEALAREVAPEFGVGISVKIRLLETPAETEALVRRLVATGITGLTVHCRTTPMRPRERAIRGQLRMVGEVCRAAGVACLMNGDVEDRDHARSLAAEHAVDGAMIATAAERNPSCFRAAADGGLAPWEEVAERYLRLAMEVGNRFGNSKYLLNQMVPGKTPVYKEMMRCKSYAAMVDVLGFADLKEEALRTDAMLGIGDASESKKGAAAVKGGKRDSSALTGEQVADVASSSKRVRTEAGEEAVVEAVPEAPVSAVALSA